jgi:hypothetical protein
LLDRDPSDLIHQSEDEDHIITNPTLMSADKGGHWDDINTFKKWIRNTQTG